MSRLAIASVALLCCLATALPLMAFAAKGPRIEFEKKEMMMNVVKEGSSVTATFPFTNTGDMNLIIDEVSPSCGCTVPEFSKVTEPGKKGFVKMILDTSGINGAFRKTAVVATNDSSNPFVTLVMLGETQSRIKVDKGRRLDLVGCLGEEIITTAVLTHPQDKPIMITGVQNPMSDYLDAEIRPLVQGKKYELILKAKSGQPVNFAGPIFLQLPGAPRVSLYVVCDVRGPFSVQPHEVFYGGVYPNAPVVRNVLIKKACARTLKIEKLTYDEKRYKVVQEWQKPDEELLLQITPLAADMPKGPFDDRIAIKADGWEFEVRLNGVVR